MEPWVTANYPCHLAIRGPTSEDVRAWAGMWRCASSRSPSRVTDLGPVTPGGPRCTGLPSHPSSLPVFLSCLQALNENPSL